MNLYYNNQNINLLNIYALDYYDLFIAKKYLKYHDVYLAYTLYLFLVGLL